MIDWKSIPKIDAHIHRLPPDVIENNRGNGDRFVEYGSVDDYLRLMDQYHIEAACVMPFNDPYMLSMDFQAGSVHNNLLAMCLQAENCLFCFADIDIRNPVETTLELLEKALEQKEFLGVKIHPTNTGYPVDGAYYDRVFAWADQSRVPVEIHSYPRTHLPDDVCSPSRIRNVIRKYPALRVSVAHAGGFQYEELIGLGLYFNISAVLTDWASQYGIEKTNHILRQLDDNRLVFATDYPDNRKLTPCEIYDRYFVILGSMGLAFGGAEIPRIHRVKHAHALTASQNYPLNIKSKGEHHGFCQARRQRHPHAGAPAGKKPPRCRRLLPAGSRHCPLLPPVEHQ